MRTFLCVVSVTFMLVGRVGAMMCPDGSYVGDGQCNLEPDGSYN